MYVLHSAVYIVGDKSGGALCFLPQKSFFVFFLWLVFISTPLVHSTVLVLVVHLDVNVAQCS